MFDFAIVTLASLFAGCVDAIVGGGGLILGPAPFGSFAGAWTLTVSSADGLRKALPIILVGLLAYTLMRKDMGITHAPSRGGRAQVAIACAIGGTVGVYDGFFGPGAGSFFVFAFERLLGFDFLGTRLAMKHGAAVRRTVERRAFGLARFAASRRMCAEQHRLRPFVRRIGCPRWADDRPCDCSAHRKPAMPVDPQLRSLNIDVPAQPEVLVKLSGLLLDENVNLQAVSALISTDMALAASVLKAVNSSLYGLRGRVQSVQQAITHLGSREIASVTFAMGLKAVFPAAPELAPLWERASVRGLLMGRIGSVLHVDPWAAHSAGLFEECGKAVLFRHASDRYRLLLAAAADDEELLMLEHDAFGVSHDALGAALCESWGLAPAAVASVRFHVLVNTTRELPMHLPRRAVCALSALAHALMTDPESLDEVAHAVAPQAGLDATLVLRGARRVQEQIEAAVAREASA